MQIGFYKHGELKSFKEYNGLTSDILLNILKDIIDNNSIEKLIYTSGPGSHMATKIAYITLKTINILQNIDFSAISAFDLNSNKPIKALGKLYFIKEKDTIITKRFNTEVKSNFFMPKSLSSLSLLESVEPDYHISAIN